MAYTIGTQPLVLSVSRLLGRAGQVVPGHRRPRRGHRAGVRSQRQVPVLLRLDRRRSGPRLVRAVRGTTCATTRNVYLAVLRKDLPSPLAKESDEEKESKADDANKEKDKEKDKDEAGIGGRAARRRRDRQCGQQDARFDAVPHRLRRTSSSGSSTCRSRPRTSRTCRPATPGRSISFATADEKTRSSGSTSRSGRPRRSCRRSRDYRVSGGREEAALQGQGLVVDRARRPRRSRPATARSPRTRSR